MKELLKDYHRLIFINWQCPPFAAEWPRLDIINILSRWPTWLMIISVTSLLVLLVLSKDV